MRVGRRDLDPQVQVEIHAGLDRLGCELGYASAYTEPVRLDHRVSGDCQSIFVKVEALSETGH